MSSAITRVNPPIPAGSGTARYRPAGVLDVLVTPVATANSAAEQDLWTFTLPANTLVTDGDSLRLSGLIFFAANANTKTAKVYFGSQSRTLNVSTTAPNGSNHHFVVEFMRTGATATLFGPTYNIVGNTLQLPTHMTGNATLSSDVTVKITGTEGTPTGSEITLNRLRLEYLPAPPDN